jgi:hypothetical protein
MTDLPEPPVEKKGLLNRATEAAKGGIEKSQQVLAARTEANAAKVAAEQEALELERRRHEELGYPMVEYKVMYLREALIGDKIDTDKLESLLNQWASRGWHLKTLTSAQVDGRVGPGGVSGLIVTLERPLPH